MRGWWSKGCSCDPCPDTVLLFDLCWGMYKAVFLKSRSVRKRAERGIQWSWPPFKHWTLFYEVQKCATGHKTFVKDTVALKIENGELVVYDEDLIPRIRESLVTWAPEMYISAKYLQIHVQTLTILGSSGYSPNCRRSVSKLLMQVYIRQSTILLEVSTVLMSAYCFELKGPDERMNQFLPNLLFAV